MTSLFKARAENSARVVTLQNEINALKAKLENAPQVDLSELDSLKRQVKLLSEENQLLKDSLEQLSAPQDSPKASSKKKEDPNPSPQKLLQKKINHV